MRSSGDNGSLSRNRAPATNRRRRRREYRTEEYVAFCGRIVHAMLRRVVVADPEDFAMLVRLSDQLDTAVQEAATGLYKAGYSWAQLGASIGITKQGARQRWGMTNDRRTA